MEIFMTQNKLPSLNNRILDFLQNEYKQDIDDFDNNYHDSKSFYVNFKDIRDYDNEIADAIIRNPEDVMELFRSNVCILSKTIPNGISLKNPLHIRITNVDNLIGIRDIRGADKYNLVSIEGLVRNITSVQDRMIKGAFKCIHCNQVTYQQQDDDEVIEPIFGCDNPDCDRKGPFIQNDKLSEFIDFQKAMVQESPDSLKGTAQPQSIEVHISHDMCGQVLPGERVVINGIIKPKPKKIGKNKSTSYGRYIDVISIEKMDNEYDDIVISPADEKQIKQLSQDPDLYTKLVASVAPSVRGCEDIKYAALMSLFSGVVKISPDGSRSRGDIHILFIGDPGVAKSKILKYCSNVSPRGIFASGRSASAAGLTAAVVKDDLGDGKWTIEAGALVMADGGIAAIDEMDKMRNEDKSSLHEAMEQQTISISKAGIIATLRSRCSVFGAANPKYGRFDIYEEISEQINMPPALLSRFDLMFIMEDKPEKEKDKGIASHIIKTHHNGEMNENLTHDINSSVDPNQLNKSMKDIAPDIDAELFKKYIAYARRSVFPILTPEANKTLIDFYMEMRSQSEGKMSVAITPRQLEAMIRLSEARAKARLSDTITTEDAKQTIRVMLACMKKVGYDSETGNFDVDKTELGRSSSQQNKMKFVEDCIRALQEKGPKRKPVPFKDIAAKVKEDGNMDEKELMQLIQKASEHDLIAKKPNDTYRTVN